MFYKLNQFLDFYLWFVLIYVINCLVHYKLDTSFYDIMSKYKINPIEKKKIEYLYRKYFPKVFKNVVLLPIPFGIVSVFLVNLDTLYTAEFSIFRCILELFYMFIVADVLFYITHRIMHIPNIYKKYHKTHHNVTIPISISTLYVDNLDLFFNNTLPLILPSFFICSHYLTIKMWFLFIITESILSHSGYMFFSKTHDDHHIKNNINFGNNFCMDKLFRHLDIYTLKI